MSDEKEKREQLALRKKPVWLLQGPFHRYKEGVKKLASEKGMRIIDSRYANKDLPGVVPSGKTPKVSLKPEFQPKTETPPSDKKPDPDKKGDPDKKDEK